MSDTDASDVVLPEPRRSRIRWKAVGAVAGLAGLALAAWTSADEARHQALPSPGALGVALALQVVAMMCAARSWIALFPPEADRHALATGLYTSQLAKYLPAGGFVQAASQVAMSSQGGMAAAALRLPVFSICAVVGAAALGSALAFAGGQPTWVRIAALCGLLGLVALDRRALAGVLRLLRRISHRVPEPSALPPQRAILTCFAFALGNLLAYAGAFALLVGDLDDVQPLVAGAAFCAGWWLGYLALPLPSGLGIREAVLVGALPGVATASVLAASVAHRLVGLVAEAGLAGRAHLADGLRARQPRRAVDMPGDDGPATTAAPVRSPAASDPAPPRRPHP